MEAAPQPKQEQPSKKSKLNAVTAGIKEEDLDVDAAYPGKEFTREISKQSSTEKPLITKVSSMLA